MSDTDDFDGEVAAFQTRVADLEMTLALRPPGDALVEAVLLELQAAAEELRVAREELTARGREAGLRQAASDRDRQVMRAVFRDLPLPTILLDRDARIRRLNRRAGRTLGVSMDYASGQPFANFVEIGARAAFRSVLAGVVRGVGERVVHTTLLRDGVPQAVDLLLSLLPVPADPHPLVSILVLPPQPAAPADTAEGAARPSAVRASVRAAAGRAARLPPPLGSPDPASGPDDDLTVRSMTRRLDLLTTLSRTLLVEHGRSEAATVQAAARLVSTELADWVVIDLCRRGDLLRAVVCGPSDSSQVVSMLEEADVAAAPYPAVVIDAPKAALHTRIEDPDLLGWDDRGIPLLARMAGHSLLSVPLLADEDPIGAITVVRSTGRIPFTLIDQGLLQEMADQVGLALQSERRIQRRSDVARAARATLVPDPIRVPPGVELAVIVQAAEDAEIGGDFLDTCEGKRWSLVLGDASGGGEPALAQAVLARHAIRLYTLDGDEPPQVLRRADEAIRRLPDSDRPIRVTVAALELGSPGHLTAHLHSAGHLSSMAVRADGRVQSVDGGGHPLAGPQPFALHSQQVPLGPNDCLVLYSDAVLSLTNARGENFVESGALARSLARVTGQPAATVISSVQSEMRTFAPEDPGDDLVLIGIRPLPAT